LFVIDRQGNFDLNQNIFLTFVISWQVAFVCGLPECSRPVWRSGRVSDAAGGDSKCGNSAYATRNETYFVDEGE